MPTEKQNAVTSWLSYQDAETAFNKIKAGKTTISDLAKIGFDSQSPNVTVLDPLTIRNLFVGTNSGLRLEDLPMSIQAYLKDFENCRGFKFQGDMMQSRGRGNLVARIFGFNKEDLITGWQFEAWIFVSKDKVAYTLWKGTPHISKVQRQQNPLGPFGDILRNAPQMAITSGVALAL
ncbi:MAG: hypothetical protein HY813_01385 [Candidatus Portnoybacteria bacterium]|nr:hypothetical protein [Candidatus Portnoybacteria bacterium]